MIASFLLLAPVAALADDATAHGTTFAQQTLDQWRTSKLTGVAIYGPDNKSVGKVTDVLMSKTGEADYVVIGVGGFLGIGEKDIAVPFDAVSFTNDPIMPATGMQAPDNNLAAATTTSKGATAPGTTTDGGAVPNGGMAPAATAGLGTAGDALGNPSVPALGTPAQMDAGASRSSAYPDHGTIAMTKEQLKSAPSFRFAK